MRVYTSTYRRAIDTAEAAFGPARFRQTSLLDEQHYGDATYMTKTELFATYPESAEDRRFRKHLWTRRAAGSHWPATCLAEPGLRGPARGELEAGHAVVAITHHTTILALRALLENVADHRDPAASAGGEDSYSRHLPIRAGGCVSFAGLSRSAPAP